MSGMRLKSPSNRLQIFVYLAGKGFAYHSNPQGLGMDAEWLRYLSVNLESVYAELSTQHTKERESGITTEVRPARRGSGEARYMGLKAEEGQP